MLLPAMFNPAEELVAARFFPAHDIEYGPGDTVKLTELGKDREDGTLDQDTALRLWLVGYLVYAKDYRPTPMETPQQEAERVVSMEDVGNGWYLLTTPWGGEGEKVHGKEAAEERRAELIAKGDTKGVTITGGDGGWYEVNAPWLEEPVKVQGKDAAAVEEAMLIQDGPPAGWVPETDEEKAARLQADADRLAAQEQAERDRVAAEEKATQDANDAAEREAAEKAAADRTAALDAAGIVITAKGGGYYELAAPSLAEPVKVRGKEAADTKADELLAAHQEAPAATETGQDGVIVDDASNQDQVGDQPQGEGPGEGATDEAPAEGVAQDKAEGEE